MRYAYHRQQIVVEKLYIHIYTAVLIVDFIVLFKFDTDYIFVSPTLMTANQELTIKASINVYYYFI